MNDARSDGTTETAPTTRARIRTTYADAATAERVAAAVRPDNTPEMDTRVGDDAVVTTVRRKTTGGLHSTVDDYVVNCAVAARLTARDPRETSHAGETRDDTESRDAGDAHDTHPHS